MTITRLEAIALGRIRWLTLINAVLISLVAIALQEPWAFALAAVAYVANCAAFLHLSAEDLRMHMEAVAPTPWVTRSRGGAR